MFTFKSFGTIALVLTSSTALLVGCGSDSSSSSALTSVDLGSIPSVSGMITANGSTSSVSAVSRFKSVGLQTVAGTPETITTYSSNSTLLDNHVFGGLISAITTANTATSSQADAFWKGQGTCMLMQSVAESLGRMLEQGTSMCYMREIPQNSSAVTITSGSIDDPTQMFVQQASDRVVKFQVEEEEGTEDIFIKVFGTNSVGSDVYKINLYFCRQGSAQGGETIEVNTANGTYSGTGSHSGEWGRGTQTVSAYLKVDANGNIVFDPSKERIANSHWTGNWGTFKGYVAITGDNKMYGKRYNNGQWGADKNYAITSFSGSSMSTLRFLEGAFVGSSTWNNEVHGYSGATEFQNTVYTSVNSSDLLTEISSYSLASDSFFTESLTVPAFSSSDDCNAAADITGTINMNTSAMQTIQATCEADRLSNYDMCWDSAIQDVQGIIFSSQNYQ